MCGMAIAGLRWEIRRAPRGPRCPCCRRPARSTNAGASWTDWTGTGATELPDNPVNALLVDAQAGLVYAGTDVGVFVSSTTTASWAEAGPAPGPGASGFLPNAPVTALQIFNPNAFTKTLVASTYGRGIWEYALVPGYANVISNSPQTVFAPQTAAFNGILTAQAGYSNAVNLSCTGATPATCTLAPTPVTPTATYTLTAGGVAGDYSFNAHAVGTDPDAITHDASPNRRRHPRPRHLQPCLQSRRLRPA